MTSSDRSACRSELIELRGEIANLHSREPEDSDWERGGVRCAHDGALDEVLELLDTHLLELGPRRRRDEFAD